MRYRNFGMLGFHLYSIFSMILKVIVHKSEFRLDEGFINYIIPILNNDTYTYLVIGQYYCYGLQINHDFIFESVRYNHTIRFY